MNFTVRQMVAALLVPTMLLTALSQAAPPTAATFTSINPVPPNVVSVPPRPLIMLNMSRDHQLFYRAYNEFTDYNNDGQPDGTYLHTLRYSGYFDPGKCYVYSSADGRFNPSTVLANRTDDCANAWHGNFLNWATMTRMDVLRKVMYGGLRFTDTATATVLERASLPMDAHSFAKFYDSGPSATADRRPINALTPFNVSQITFCNTTLGDNNTISQTNTNPPLLRAASGNFALWNAHERRQCRWAEENIWNAGGDTNGNNFAVTGFGAGAGYPARNSVGLNTSGVTNADYIVRVAACVSGLTGSERCRQYPSGNSKPIGLLQEYGEPDLAEFGLLTGAYSTNTSGGVLRKNASSFRNEVNYTTNGTFITGAGGIVQTLDRLKVYGFRYSDAIYAADDNDFAGNDFCAFQTIGLVDNQCASWGNPIGEMFIETLRYLRGQTPAAAYGANTDPKGAVLGLTTVNWIDPFTRGASIDQVFGAPQCRPINTVTFNASVNSYDGNTVGPFADLGAASSLSTYINSIGAGEGINGTNRFVGNIIGGATADRNSACTSKTLAGLADAEGLCPAAPAYRGTFSLAGAAYWANTNPVRAVPTGMATDDAARAYRVRSYAVALAPGVPRIEVRAGTGPTAPRAVIQPAYRLDLGGNNVGSGTLVDFRVISQTATGGRYLVIWEDSEQGGDYDQDAAGILEWSLSGTTLTVTTDVYAQSTANPQGFGYTISGTNRDGVHFHSGLLGFNFTDPTGAPGCTNCQVPDPPTTATYTVNGNVGGFLQDPMWYAAKWGGFREANNLPGTAPAASGSNWDTSNNVTGAAGADGVPDNYFEVFNPDQLEASLRRVFQSAVTVLNSAPAVSSTELVTGGFKFVASYDPDSVTGNIEAFRVDANGNFPATPTWQARNTLTQASDTPAEQTARNVITNDQATGFSFDWASISSGARTSYRNLLLNGTTTLTATDAEAVVNFMRGSDAREGAAFRGRNVGTTGRNILGPIVNASPWLQERPRARFVDRLYPGYSTFATSQANRQNVVWAAANDGMLHALNAETGAPILSYVPEALVPRLNQLVVPGGGVQAFVDGSPFTADIDINSGVSGTPAWRTYVFGSLGRGGRGIFALDATTISDLNAGNAANVFRWQFTAEDDSDLGHVLSDVSIEPGTNQAAPVVKLEDGRFAMIFGNGVRSTNGRAVLFIVPVQGPGGGGSWSGRYHKIELDPNTGGTAPNGLSTPTMLDVDNNGRVDTVYVGDLRGNLWKVDLSSATPASWRSAYLNGSGQPTPLFAPAAGDPIRPITGAPQFAFPPFGGTIVNFATGRSIDPADFPNTAVTQRVYGIWDRPAFATGARTLPRGTGTLVERTLSRQGDGSVIVTSAPAIDFQNADAGVARDGWFFNLPGSSEMVLSNLEFRVNNIFFTSVRPPAGGNTNACTQGADASFWFFDPIVGFATRSTLGDVVVSGTTYRVIAVSVPDQKVRVTRDTTRTSITPPGGGAATPCPNALRIVGRSTDLTRCFSDGFARIQWREVPGMRTN